MIVGFYSVSRHVIKLFASRDTSRNLHGASRTAGFYPYPFLTSCRFLPLDKDGALISNGSDAKLPPRSPEKEPAW